MLLKLARCRALRSIFGLRWGCWCGALSLAAACAGGSTEQLPVAARPVEPALASPTPQPTPVSPAQPEGETRGLSWAVPAGGSQVGLSLKVALDTGGGEVRANAAGELLISGPRAVGSGKDQQYRAALARRDAAGTGLWAQAYTEDARLFSVLEEDGSTLAAGYFSGSLGLAGAELSSFRNPAAAFGSAVSGTGRRGQPSQDIAVLRLTPQGNVAWARRFGDAGDQGALAIGQGAAGELVVAGSFVGQLVMDELSVTSSGGGSRADTFIARLDGNGAVSSLWREEPLHVDALAVEPDGSLWIAGRQNELSGNRLWKLGADGQRQLSIVIDEESTAYASGLALGPSGSVYVVYDSTGFTSLLGRRIAGDSVLVRLSSAGEVAWLRTLSAEHASSSVAADRAGNVAIAGTFGGSLDLGAGPLASGGSLDLFLASFSAEGELRYSLRMGSSGFDGGGPIAARPAGGWLIPFYVELPILLGSEQVTAGEHLLWVDEQ